jgi:hypothetical protein
MFVACSSRNETHHLTCTLDLTIAIILTHRPQVASPFGHGRPSIDNPPDRLLGRNFSGKNLLTGKKAETQRWWALGSLKKKRKELIYWGPDCHVGLCREGCSEVFHFQADHSTLTAEDII